MVQSTCEAGGKIERETRFYITSLALIASLIGPLIRDHWAVERLAGEPVIEPNTDRAIEALRKVAAATRAARERS